MIPCEFLQTCSCAPVLLLAIVMLLVMPEMKLILLLLDDFMDILDGIVANIRLLIW